MDFTLYSAWVPLYNELVQNGLVHNRLVHNRLVQNGPAQMDLGALGDVFNKRVNWPHNGVLFCVRNVVP